MKAKEKANELANKFISKSVFDMTDKELKEQREQGKSFALICVDECIKEHCHESEHKDPNAQDRWIEYWQNVKRELSLL